MSTDSTGYTNPQLWRMVTPQRRSVNRPVTDAAMVSTNRASSHHAIAHDHPGDDVAMALMAQQKKNSFWAPGKAR